MEIARGFFEGRRTLNIQRIKGDGPQKRFAEYLNVSSIIGTLLSKRMATLHELDTVYGTRDVYDMLEIISIDDYNHALAKQE